MRQRSLTDGFEKHRKKTRQEKFRDDMEVIIPWQGLVEAIEPHYPKPSGAGRRPIGIERMLRIYFLQHWFNLSDPAAEEALYDSRAMREFVGVDLGQEPAPDETTICNFRHLMERHKAHIGVDSRTKLMQTVNSRSIKANLTDGVGAMSRCWCPGRCSLAEAAAASSVEGHPGGQEARAPIGYRCSAIDNLLSFASTMAWARERTPSFSKIRVT